MGVFVDLTEQKFGFLKAIEKTKKRASSGSVVWLCLCDCGKYHEVASTSLKNGQTKSCGCLFLDVAKSKGHAKRTHGMTATRIYSIWTNMKGRCYSKTNTKYPTYGGRGIVVCDAWKDSFESFFLDMGHPPEGCTLDRIDVNGNYEKSNCRWATQKEQQNNRRNNVIITVGEKPMTMAEYCDENGLNADKVQQRLKRGWSQERAVAK